MADIKNSVGDALYCLERFDQAREAYLQAERIEPGNARTNLNLGYVYLNSGQHREALDALARGLAGDLNGIYRDRLLAKQNEVLLDMSRLSELERQRIVRRIQRFAP